MQCIIVGYRPYFILILLCLVLYLPGLSAVPILDRDEARFAQATRQMVETGDFVSIRFQNAPRHKKPIGIHWLQAAAVIAFADQVAIWPYRLPSVVGAIAAVLLTFHFGQVLFDRYASMLGATLLGNSLMLVIEAHQAKTDAVLLACVVAAQGTLANFYLYHWKSHINSQDCVSCQAPTRGTVLVFWIAQGIGILIKGPIVPVISGLTVIGLCGWERRWPKWLMELQPLIGVTVIAILVTPWFLAINLVTDGDFFDEAIHGDLLPKLLGAQESHGAPPGYFLLLVILTFWPASLFLCPAIIHAWRQRVTPQIRFCLTWSGLVWLLFEAIPTKLPHYVLPTYPALALLIATTLLTAKKKRLSPLALHFVCFWNWTWIVLTIVLSCALLAAPLLLGSRGILYGVVPAGAITVAAWLAIWLVQRQRLLLAATATGSIAGIVIIFVFAFLIPSLDGLWLSQRVYATLDTAGVDFTSYPIATAGYYEPSIVFLFGTDTILSDGKGAAAHLSTTHSVVIVSQKEDQTFQLALAGRELKSERLSIVYGFNYSRGHCETLYLYTIRHESPR